MGTHSSLRQKPGVSPFAGKAIKLSFSFFLFYKLFIFGCVGSSFLCIGYLWLQQAGASLHCRAQASHCGGFCCAAQALGTQASVVAAHGLSSCGAQA